MNSCLFFVPARGGSKRFPLKNIALLEGRPLVAHVVGAIAAAEPDAEIVISTDDERVARAVREDSVASHCCNLRIDLRPAELATDKASVAEVLREYLSRARPQQASCCCVYPTAVLLSTRIIRESVERFENDTDLNSLMSASEFNLHPWQALYRDSRGRATPYFPDLFAKKSQEFPHFCASNGQLYLVRCDKFIANPSFYAPPLDVCVIPAAECVDINYPEDLAKVERIKLWQKQEQPLSPLTH